MIKSLTSLRGIFILFIFFHHCLHLYPGGGTMAVAFFFVLSGYSMTLGYKDRILRPDFSYKQYLTRRCIRFFPLHWLCLIAVLPLVILSFKPEQVPIFFINASLLQTWIPIHKVYFSFNWVSWYLADTMFFAIVFPIVSKWILGCSTKGRIAIATGFTIVYVIVATLLPIELRHAILYISPYMRLTDFVFGIFLALGYSEIKDKVKPLKNRYLWELIVFTCIILLVIESSLISESTSFIAPVYWIFVSVVILSASLTSRDGGGHFVRKQISSEARRY